MKYTTDEAQLINNVIDQGPLRARQLLVIGLCFLLNVIDGFDITAMAVVAKSVSDELSVAPQQLGLIFSFALAGMMAGAMLVAPIADIIGRRKTIIIGIALIGVTVLLTAYADSLTEFIILRFLSGIGAGTMLATQAALAAEYAPDKYRAMAVTTITAGYPLGGMMTAVIANWIMPEYGWRGMFIFGGGVTLVLILVVMLLLPESLKFLLEARPRHALARINHIFKSLKVDPIDALPELRESQQKSGSNNMLANMLELLSKEYRVRTITIWLCFFFSISTLYFLFSWVPKMVEDAGNTAQNGRTAFLLMNLGGFVGTFLLAGLSTRLSLSKLVGTFLGLCGLSMILFGQLDVSLIQMYAVIFLIGVLQMGGYSGLYAVASKAYPTALRGTGVGWAIGLGRIGAVIGPYLAGLTIAAGVSMGGNFMIFAIPLIVSAAIALSLAIK